MGLIADLIRSGALVPVQVFGTECSHNPPEDFSFGLCDRFSTHTPGGSDCNRAEYFLLRPNDLTFEGSTAEIEDLEEIRAALKEVLDE